MINLTNLKQSPTVHLCFTISYFMSGLVLSIIQGILFFGLRPFNKALYRKINYYLTYYFYSQLVCLSQWSRGTTPSFYVKKDKRDFYGNEQDYFLMNHSNEIDWLMGWHGYRNRVPGLLMTPEEIRFTQTKHEASPKIAKEKNVPLLKTRLMPRTRGFTTSLQCFRNNIPAIWQDRKSDFEKDSKDKRQKTKSKRTTNLNQESFMNTGNFFLGSGAERAEPFKVPPRIYYLLNALGWAVITLMPMLYLLYKRSVVQRETAALLYRLRHYNCLSQSTKVYWNVQNQSALFIWN